MSYRFVQGIDYGHRKGTIGFSVHMAEGGDGTVRYLARHAGETEAEWKRRVRGVSANFCILSTGEVVQMVRWDNASGSMNPADRSNTTGFYRTQVIQAVLGSRYTDPNAWSLSVEITGFRAKGPNSQQVDALLELVETARRKYPTLRGAYGHADQTDTKGCPGIAPGMMRFWNTVGHGLFTPPSPPKPPEVPVESFTVLDGPSGSLTVKPDPAIRYMDLADGSLHPAAGLGTKQPAHPIRLTKPIPGGTGDRATGYLIGAKAAFLLAVDVDFTPTTGDPQEYQVTVGGKPAGSVTLP